MNRIKANIIGLALLLCTLPSGAQMKWNQTYQTYINQYKDLAIEQMLKYRIPASITLAQGLFESAAGRSSLVRQGNNHFGIKCHTSWTGPTQYHDDDARGECFRVYSDARESYEDHSRFLARQQRYARLFSLNSNDYKGWARGLKQCGYATNPQYANKLIQIIELYKLHDYDKENATTNSWQNIVAQISRSTHKDFCILSTSSMTIIICMPEREKPSRASERKWVSVGENWLSTTKETSTTSCTREMSSI